jgi:hypothetical protein
MTLHQITKASKNRDFDPFNPHRCMECGEYIMEAVSTCVNTQGQVYSFHSGRCYCQHIAHDWDECCGNLDQRSTTRRRERLTVALARLDELDERDRIHSNVRAVRSRTTFENAVERLGEQYEAMLRDR